MSIAIWSKSIVCFCIFRIIFYVICTWIHRNNLEIRMVEGEQERVIMTKDGCESKAKRVRSTELTYEWDEIYFRGKWLC